MMKLCMELCFFSLCMSGWKFFQISFRISGALGHDAPE